MIEYKNVALRYTEKDVLRDVNLRIENGEFMVLVGPSGSGKTTMVKMVNRLLEPTDGNIYMDGKRIKDYDERELRLSTGYVLQAIALFPNLTVAENIALIPEMKGWTKEEIAKKTEELLAKVGLPVAEYGHRLPNELSGGEQQRVGIVRAMIGQPKILLMDEILQRAGLDAGAGQVVQPDRDTGVRGALSCFSHCFFSLIPFWIKSCLSVKGEGHMLSCPSPYHHLAASTSAMEALAASTTCSAVVEAAK